MDPVTLAGISLASTVIGTGVGVAGAIGQANAQADTARYQAAVARNNQIIAGQNARYAAQAGEAEAQQQGFTQRARMGRLIASQSASGIDLNSESSQEVRDSQEQLGRLDIANIIQKANLTKYGEEQRGVSFGAQAQLDEATARNAQTAGVTNTFSSILGGASSFADKWLRYQNVGTFPGLSTGAP